MLWIGSSSTSSGSSSDMVEKAVGDTLSSMRDGQFMYISWPRWIHYATVTNRLVGWCLQRKPVPCIKFHHSYITTLGQLDSTAWLWHTILRPRFGLLRIWWQVSRNQVYSSLKHWGWVQVHNKSRESNQASGDMLIELVTMQKHLSHQHTTNTGAHDCWGAKVN